MQEMNLIPRSIPDDPATGISAMISTLAPGLRNSGRDKMAKSDKFMWMFTS
jgi:hypothetical protein